MEGPTFACAGGGGASENVDAVPADANYRLDKGPCARV